MKDIIISGKTLTGISKLYFNTDDGKQVCFIEESELGSFMSVEGFRFAGSSVIGYNGSETQITIPTSYSKSNIKIEHFYYDDFYIFYSDVNNGVLSFPVIVEDVLHNTSITIASINNIWDHYSTLNNLININGSITVACETFTPIPGSEFKVTTIGYSAFRENHNLTNIVIPNGIENIEDYAFFNCSKLLTVSIPDSLKTFGDSVFYACNILTHTAYGGIRYLGNGDNPYIIASGPDRNNLLSDYNAEEGCKFIDHEFFYGMSNLKSITLPSTLLGICSFAFYNSGLQTVKIKATSVPTLANTSSIRGKIYVLDNLYNDYLTATNWSSMSGAIYKLSELGE